MTAMQAQTLLHLVVAGQQGDGHVPSGLESLCGIWIGLEVADVLTIDDGDLPSFVKQLELPHNLARHQLAELIGHLSVGLRFVGALLSRRGIQHSFSALRVDLASGFIWLEVAGCATTWSGLQSCLRDAYRQAVEGSRPVIVLMQSDAQAPSTLQAIPA